MSLEEMIYKRQSHRDFKETPCTPEVLEDILDFIDNSKPLFPDIKLKVAILGNDDISSIVNWKAPHYLTIFSEEKEGYLENVGFIFQQLDLYLASIGIGAVWYGLAKFKAKSMEAKELAEDENYRYVICIAFGEVKSELYRQPDQFNRRTLCEISEDCDPRLEVARLAPSAVNSQPWYFTSIEGICSIYREKLNIVKRKMLGYFNRIDIGIALAHIYVANPETFRLAELDDPEEVKGYEYYKSFEF